MQRTSSSGLIWVLALFVLILVIVAGILFYRYRKKSNERESLAGKWTVIQSGEPANDISIRVTETSNDETAWNYVDTRGKQSLYRYATGDESIGFMYLILDQPSENELCALIGWNENKIHSVSGLKKNLYPANNRMIFVRKNTSYSGFDCDLNDFIVSGSAAYDTLGEISSFPKPSNETMILVRPKVSFKSVLGLE